MLSFPQEFLQEEVREGFTVDATMKSCWAAQLEVLREISEVCERHNLQWFCAYGTLLGAVRHQGFIPWDDDMDIWMLREDYNKFLQVAETELPKGYVIDGPLTETGYTEYHTLILNARSLSINPERLKRFHGCPFATGVDIFPLDYLPRNQADRENVLEIMTLMSALVGIAKKEEWEEADVEDIINGRNTIADILNVEFEEEIKIENKKKIVSEIYKVANYLAMSYGEEDGDELVMYISYLTNSNKIFHKSLFSEVIEMPFEMFGVPVPCGYDVILRKQYGDYTVRVQNAAGHEYPLYKKQVKALREALEAFEGTVKRYEELTGKREEETC